MLRGCEKRVVHVKNTGDELFEEAYFFLKAGASESVPPAELWKAAERIVSDSLLSPAMKGGAHPKRRERIRMLLSFASGLLFGGATIAFCLFL